MNQSLDTHELADLADHYFGQVAAVAFAARLSVRELDRDSHQDLLAAIESLSVVARKAIEGLCEGAK